jgi:hypothetical protein
VIALSTGFVQTSGVIVNVLFTYRLKPFDQFAYLQAHPKRFFPTVEMRAAVGPSLALFSKDYVLASTHRIVGVTSASLYNTIARHDQPTWGVTTLFETDVYISRYLSSGVGVETLWFPRFHIDAVDLYNPYAPSRLVKSIEESWQPLLLMYISVGLRLHL